VSVPIDRYSQEGRNPKFGPDIKSKGINNVSGRMVEVLEIMPSNPMPGLRRPYIRYLRFDEPECGYQRLRNLHSSYTKKSTPLGSGLLGHAEHHILQVCLRSEWLNLHVYVFSESWHDLEKLLVIVRTRTFLRFGNLCTSHSYRYTQAKNRLLLGIYISTLRSWML